MEPIKNFEEFVNENINESNKSLVKSKIEQLDKTITSLMKIGEINRAAHDTLVDISNQIKIELDRAGFVKNMYPKKY